MKKKILSAEALALLAGKQPIVPEADADTNKPDVNPPAADANDGLPEGEADSDEGEDLSAEDVAKLEASIAEAAGKLTEADAKIKALTEEVEALKAEAITTDAKIKAAEAVADDFRTIVVGQIGQMRCALSLADVDMGKWTGAAVLKEFEATSESFQKALPVGSVVPEPSAQKTEQKTPSSLDVAAKAALGF